MKEKLMYEWSGCACSVGHPQEVTGAWSKLQNIWGSNLCIIGYYDLDEVRRRLEEGEKEVRIANICANCRGAGDDIYFLKPED